MHSALFLLQSTKQLPQNLALTQQTTIFMLPQPRHTYILVSVHMHKHLPNTHTHTHTHTEPLFLVSLAYTPISDKREAISALSPHRLDNRKNLKKSQLRYLQKKLNIHETDCLKRLI